MIGRNDLCWCGSNKKWKKCHFPEQAPTAFSDIPENIADLYYKRHKIILKTPEQIEGIRRSCQLASEILDKTCKMAKEGITTLELNEYCHQLHLAAGAIPAPLGYGTPPF